MLNRPRRPKRPHCLKLKRKEVRRRAKKPRSRTPARSIREAVRNRGGETSKVIFARGNTLDQMAYIKMRIKIDIRLLSCAPRIPENKETVESDYK